MFEFNFGDTEVFWILLDIFTIVIAFLEGVGGRVSGVGEEAGERDRRASAPTPDPLLPPPSSNELRLDTVLPETGP
jgi:hypothetical protein